MMFYRYTRYFSKAEWRDSNRTMSHAYIIAILNI
ncbi:hypothetical protein BX604_4127 [Burkholderia sp. JKS000303]|nr:hypothetical protein BX604_4127 [Burkholderia sp. JKS000303]